MRILSLVFCAAVAAAGTTPLIAQDTLGREPVSLLQVLDSVAARYPSLEAARALTAWLDSVVAYNRSRVKEGVAAEADLIRSELERDRAEADASMQEADLARARAELSVFLGEEPGPFAVVALDAPLALPDVALAGRARPDIRAARERVTAAGAGVTTERTNLIRQLGLTVGTKRTSGTTS